MMQARFALILPACALVAACASPASEYPTLAIRDVERVSGSMAATQPAPYVPAAPAAATLDQVAQFAAEARAAHAEFLAAVPASRQLAMRANGAAAGSERWSVAQVAVADLESRRGATLIALAELDRIYVDISNAGEAIASVEDARAEIVAITAEQDAIIASLLEQFEQ